MRARCFGPIGDADQRLGVQDKVIGVVLDDGTTLAFEVAALDSAAEGTADGEVIAELAGVTIERDGGGYRATLEGDEVAAHQAFWFAWSQFHPDTLLWPDDG